MMNLQKNINNDSFPEPSVKENIPSQKYFIDLIPTNPTTRFLITSKDPITELINIHCIYVLGNYFL